MIKPWTEVKLLHFKTRSHWSDDTLSFIADNGNPNPSVRLPFRIMNKATKEIVTHFSFVELEQGSGFI